MAHTTQTQTATSTRTAVIAAVAVVVATVVGTTVGFFQWQNSSKGGLTVEDLYTIGGIDDDTIVLRGNGVAGSDYGSAVANAGDINGDGYEDIIVSDPNYEDSGYGAVYGYYGAADTVSTTASWEVMEEREQFGYSLDGAGDVNGDGYADVIIGSPEDRGGTGSVEVYYGSAAGPNTTADWQVDGLPDGSTDHSYLFGDAVAGLGDVNGDGYDDVAIDTADHNGGILLEVYYGSATGLSTAVGWSYTMDSSSTDQAVKLVGANVNGDGYADLIFGNENYTLRGHGTMVVFHGSATGFGRRPNYAANGNSTTNQTFGYSVAYAGDVNSDGYDDVVVSDPEYSRGEDAEGQIVVYYGSSSGLRSTSRWVAESNKEVSVFGIVVTGVGDSDGNGYDDVLVTAPNYDVDGDGAAVGRGYIFGGSATGMVRAPLGIAGAEAIDGADGFGISAAAGHTIVGADTVDTVIGTDLVVSLEQYDDGTSGPAVLIYPNINL